MGGIIKSVVRWDLVSQKRKNGKGGGGITGGGIKGKGKGKGGNPGVGKGGTLWTPANTSLELWLDANDDTTVTVVSNAVSQIDDKSGNARHATQSTVAQRPPYNAAGKYMETNYGTHHVKGSYPKAVVESDFVFAIAVDWWEIGTYVGYPTFFQFVLADTGMVFWNYNAAAAKRIQMYVNGAVAANSPAQSYTTAPGMAVFTITRSGNDWEIFHDGTSVATGTLASGTLNATETYRLGAGSFSTSTGAKANHYEALIGSVLADRQKLEGYMAHRFGIEANLPSDHPYRYVAPTV